MTFQEEQVPVHLIGDDPLKAPIPIRDLIDLLRSPSEDLVILKELIPSRKEIFVLTACANGVLHYRDGAWTRELPEAPASVSRLCVAGDNTLMLIAAFPQPGGTLRGSAHLTAPVVFRAWQRTPDDRWTGPRDLAREDEPLPIDDNRAGFMVPRYSLSWFILLISLGPLPFPKLATLERFTFMPSDF